jgi:hypothetical protein
MHSSLPVSYALDDEERAREAFSDNLDAALARLLSLV